MPQYLLAHDLGTSGNKATLFDSDGRLVANRTSAYETNFLHNNWAEQDPADWWRAGCYGRAIRGEVSVRGRMGNASIPAKLGSGMARTSWSPR